MQGSGSHSPVMGFLVGGGGEESSSPAPFPGPAGADWKGWGIGPGAQSSSGIVP